MPIHGGARRITRRPKAVVRRKKGRLTRKEKKAVSTIVKRTVSLSEEKKYLNTTLAGITINNVTWNPYQLLVPSQGDNSTDRLGNKITPFKIEMRGYINNPLATQVAFRMLLIRWKASNSLTSPATQADRVFDLSTIADAWKSPFSIPNRPTFDVLYDRTMMLTPGSSGNCTDNQCRLISRTFKLSSKKMIFDSDTVTTGTNQIYVIFLSDNSSSIQLNSYWRFWFTDA